MKINYKFALIRHRYAKVYNFNKMKKITFGTRELNKLLDDTLMTKYTFASETLM
jgi:hypothetical protein